MAHLLGNDHNKPHSLKSDPTSTMYHHNMSCDLSNKLHVLAERYGCFFDLILYIAVNNFFSYAVTGLPGLNQ